MKNQWDRQPTETLKAFEAFAVYLEHGSLRTAFRKLPGKASARNAPGTWTAWSRTHDWVRRRAAYVDNTVSECQEATQIGLVLIRKRLIDAAGELLDKGGIPASLAASRIVRETFPPVERVADVSTEERIEDLPDLPDEALDRMREIRDDARKKIQNNHEN